MLTVKKIKNRVKALEKKIDYIYEAVAKQHETITKLHDVVSDTMFRRQQTNEWYLCQINLMMKETLLNNELLYGDAYLLLQRFLHKDILKINNKVILESKNPLAIESIDHLHPEATLEGISRHLRFVHKCEKLFGYDLSFLDIGCGAGGLIFDFALSNHLAIGIDGTDFNLNAQHGFWRIMPKNFFTCDITKKFSLSDKETKSTQQFEIITSWEVLEHIPESGLAQLFTNVHEHLKGNGLFVGSISMLEYRDDEKDIIYHVTLHDKEWWAKKFAEHGLIFIDDHGFEFHDFYRGVGGKYQDLHNYHTNPEAGFHFVAKKR